MFLLCEATPPLACIIEASVLGEFKRGFKGRRSTLSSLSLTFHSVNSPYYLSDFTIFLCSHFGFYTFVICFGPFVDW